MELPLGGIPMVRERTRTTARASLWLLAIALVAAVLALRLGALGSVAASCLIGALGAACTTLVFRHRDRGIPTGRGGGARIFVGLGLSLVAVSMVSIGVSIGSPSGTSGPALLGIIGLPIGIAWSMLAVLAELEPRR